MSGPKRVSVSVDEPGDKSVPNGYSARPDLSPPSHIPGHSRTPAGREAGEGRKEGEEGDPGIK